MKLNFGWFLILILLLNYSSIEGKSFLVSDYGAYSNDGIDDTDAIQLTINAAIHYGSGSDIIFASGIYTITSPMYISDASNINIRGQGMDQTFLIGTNPGMIFVTDHCQGLTFKAFSVDFNPLPFTAGYIAEITNEYLDLQVVPPHQTDVGRQVQGIFRYDPIQMRPAFGPNTYEIYQRPTSNDSNTTIVAPGILRIPLKSPTNFVKGDPIVARYMFVNPVIYGQDVTDITIQSITMYTSWGMGFAILRGRRLNVIDYHMIPRTGRWMSSVIDCMHFTDARESISIVDSICQGMGDDGLNVHATFLLVTDIINSTTIMIQAIKDTGPLNVDVGTNLEFSSKDLPYTVYGNGTVAFIVFNSTNIRKITFTSSINVSVGDWVCVADTPRLTIRNFTVSHNRARGVLLETRNVDIRQSVFNRTSGPAVLIQPSMYWYEGPEARNVTLVENLYIENNEGIAQEKAIITILPNPIQVVPVINDIRIESSSFYFGEYSQGFLQSDNANKVFINGNYITTNNLTSFISICNSRNISAVNNCVVTNQTKVDQYYIYDDRNPCSMNMSSMINLSPAAFNSSFSPPVFQRGLSLDKHEQTVSNNNIFILIRPTKL